MTDDTLGTALPEEIQRVEALLAEYQGLGLAGIFGADAIERDLAAARQAMAAQDVTAMLLAYLKLKDCE